MTDIINFLQSSISIFFWIVVILVPLVAIHEFGHYLMARLNGVKIPEFAIGFPVTKRWFHKRWKGTVWSFYPVVIGGFVRIHGDNDALDQAWEESKTDPNKAASEYIDNRLQEIIANQELQFFLEDNSLEYDQSWKDFSNSKYLEGETKDLDEKTVADYESKYNQLVTLIGWEMEKNLEASDSLYKKNWLQQTMIISGGVLFNFITAILILWVLFTFVNQTEVPKRLVELPNIYENADYQASGEYVQIASVAEDTEASKIGLEPQDYLISYAGNEVINLNSIEDLKKIISDNKDQDVIVKYQDVETGEIREETVNVQDVDGRTIFGIGPLYREVTFKAKGPIAGFRMAWWQTGYVVTETIKVFGDILVALLPTTEDRTALNYVGGPIQVGAISSLVFAEAGLVGILEIMALVSISLGVFNLLQIPVLDGGRWLIITINKLTKKRNRRLEASVISVTFILMLILAVVVAANDIRRGVGQ